MSEEIKEEKREKFLKKDERKICWAAKDAFWACLDKVNGDVEEEQCKQVKAAYHAACPQSWVVHFDRKYNFEKFKTRMQAVGYQAIDAENEKKKKKEKAESKS